MFKLCSLVPETLLVVVLQIKIPTYQFSFSLPISSNFILRSSASVWDLG